MYVLMVGSKNISFMGTNRQILKKSLKFFSHVQLYYQLWVAIKACCASKQPSAMPKYGKICD